MAQNTIVYLAVDADGTEVVFSDIPEKATLSEHYWYSKSDFVVLPKGTIKKLTGKELTFEMGYISYVSDDYDPTPE